MPKPYTAPAPFSDEQPLVINMTLVESNQVAAIGYDPESRTLAVTFTRGGALYQYPDVEPEVHAAFIGAESIGRYFGAHIKALPFKKFMPREVVTEVILPPYFRTRAIRDVAPARTEQGAVGRRDVA
jgi:hypothetical protein